MYSNAHAAKPLDSDYICVVFTEDGDRQCGFLKGNSILSNVIEPVIYDVVNRIDLTPTGRDGITYAKLVVALIHNVTSYQEVISTEFNREPDEITSDGYGNQYAVFYGVDDVEIRYQVIAYDPEHIIVTQGQDQDLIPLHNPYVSDAYFYAYQYQWTGNYGASLIAKASWSFQKQTKDTWYKKGLDFTKQGKYDEAIKAFNKVIGLDPTNATIWHNKANIFNAIGKYNESLKACDKAIELNPNDVEAWYNKGNILYNLSKYNESLEAYETIIKINPKYKTAWIQKGQILSKIGKNNDALIAFDEAIELDPKDAEAWFSKGSILDNMGKYEEAVKVYDQVIELKPSFAKAMFNRSKALMHLNSK